ncbi:hypothetical protein OIHEL45_00375 [Sulfitobacter indolifex HEL-45]|uniref:Uncharacterized protein n=1 Tax=Sulfitobacter indolifex HEL-45 TaxID=391624 RepID=A0ABP2D754_9RHOB|nr:hypothetical protein OIHEL45_00375 [Sulfitobacter indolifex HEL-45]
MLELAQRFGFDLTNTFTGDRELLADLFKRMVSVHADAKTHPQDTFLTRGERRQHAGCGFLQVLLNGGIQRQHCVLVFDEVAKLAVFLVADWRLEADRLLGNLHHLADLFERHLQLLGQFLGRWLTANLVQHLATGADQLIDRLNHVHRNTDGARLIGDRAGDRLTDPPGRIGREFVAATVFELIHGLHQADVAFLNKIKELQTTVRVLFGDGDDETQVRFDHLFLGLTGFFFALLNLLHDAAEFRDIKANVLTNLRHVVAQLIHFLGRAFDEHLPATTGFLGHPLHPIGIKLIAAVVVDEFLAVDARLVGKLHHGAVDLHDAAVDAVQLVNQGFDTVVVQV